MGVLSVPRHALASRCDRVCVYGDSKLVISQVQGTWKCHAANLAPYYEDGLRLVRRLHDTCSTGFYKMSHVYREFSAGADSLAIVGIDQHDGVNCVVVSDNWLP